MDSNHEASDTQAIVLLEQLRQQYLLYPYAHQEPYRAHLIKSITTIATGRFPTASARARLVLQTTLYPYDTHLMLGLASELAKSPDIENKKAASDWYIFAYRLLPLPYQQPSRKIIVEEMQKLALDTNAEAAAYARHFLLQTAWYADDVMLLSNAANRLVESGVAENQKVAIDMYAKGYVVSFYGYQQPQRKNIIEGLQKIALNAELATAALARAKLREMSVFLFDAEVFLHLAEGLAASPKIENQSEAIHWYVQSYNAFLASYQEPDRKKAILGLQTLALNAGEAIAAQARTALISLMASRNAELFLPVARELQNSPRRENKETAVELYAAAYEQLNFSYYEKQRQQCVDGLLQLARNDGTQRYSACMALDKIAVAQVNPGISEQVRYLNILNDVIASRDIDYIKLNTLKETRDRLMNRMLGNVERVVNSYETKKSKAKALLEAFSNPIFFEHYVKNATQEQKRLIGSIIEESAKNEPVIEIRLALNRMAANLGSLSAMLNIGYSQDSSEAVNFLLRAYKESASSQAQTLSIIKRLRVLAASKNNEIALEAVQSLLHIMMSQENSAADQPMLAEVFSTMVEFYKDLHLRGRMVDLDIVDGQMKRVIEAKKEAILADPNLSIMAGYCLKVVAGVVKRSAPCADQIIMARYHGAIEDKDAVNLALNSYWQGIKVLNSNVREGRNAKNDGEMLKTILAELSNLHKLHYEDPTVRAKIEKLYVGLFKLPIFSEHSPHRELLQEFAGSLFKMASPVSVERLAEVFNEIPISIFARNPDILRLAGDRFLRGSQYDLAAKCYLELADNQEVPLEVRLSKLEVLKNLVTNGPQEVRDELHKTGVLDAIKKSIKEKALELAFQEWQSNPKGIIKIFEGSELWEKADKKQLAIMKAAIEAWCEKYGPVHSGLFPSEARETNFWGIVARLQTEGNPVAKHFIDKNEAARVREVSGDVRREIKVVEKASWFTRNFAKIKEHASNDNLLALNLLVTRANPQNKVVLSLKIAMLTADVADACERFGLTEKEVLAMRETALKNLQHVVKDKKNANNSLAVWALKFLEEPALKDYMKVANGASGRRMTTDQIVLFALYNLRGIGEIDLDVLDQRYALPYMQSIGTFYPKDRLKELGADVHGSNPHIVAYEDNVEEKGNRQKLLLCSEDEWKNRMQEMKARKEEIKAPGKKIKLFSEPPVPKKAEAKTPAKVEEKKAEKAKRPPPKALSM